jgi:hypothetical protein
MLSPWSCQSPPSVDRVRTFSCRDLVRGLSFYRPDFVRAHRQLLESARILASIFVTTHGRLSESRHVFHRLPF